MADTIRDLLVRLGVDAGDSDAQVTGLDKSLDTLKTTMLGAVAVGAAVTTALLGMATGAANAGDAVAQGAQRTGLGVEAYQELAYAASQSNLETSELNLALAKQTESLARLSEGNADATAAYKALGLSQADLKGLGTDAALELVAGKLAGVTDEQKRLQMATDLYGSALAGKLMPLLSEGADGIAGLRDEAHALGLVMSEGDVTAAADFNDGLGRLWQIVLAIRNEVGNKLIPFLNMLIARVQEWVATNRDLIDDRITVWMGRLVDGLTAIWTAAGIVDDIVQATFGGWGPILGVASALVGAVAAAFVYLQLLEAWGAITGAIAAIGTVTGLAFGEVLLVVGALVAEFVVLGLIIQDVWTYFQGGDSVTGRLLQRFPALQAFATGLGRAFVGVKDAASSLWTMIEALGRIWWEVFSRTSLPILKLVGAAVVYLATEGFGLLGWWLNNVVVPALGLVASVFDWVAQKAAALAAYLAPLTTGLDRFLGAASAVLGVNLGGGSASTDTGAAGQAPGGTSSPLVGPEAAAGFAPSAGEVTGTTGGQPGGATSVVTQGNNITINGAGLTAEEVQALIDSNEESRARATSAALAGAEV